MVGTPGADTADGAATRTSLYFRTVCCQEGLSAAIIAYQVGRWLLTVQRPPQCVVVAAVVVIFHGGHLSCTAAAPLVPSVFFFSCGTVRQCSAVAVQPVGKRWMTMLPPDSRTGVAATAKRQVGKTVDGRKKRMT